MRQLFIASVRRSPDRAAASSGGDGLTRFGLKAVGAAAMALALAACGSSGTEADNGSVSMQDMAKAAEGIPKPVAGQYESTVELLDMQMPGVPEQAKAQMRAAAAEGMAKTNRFCLTEEEAAKGAEQLLQNMADSTCSVERFDVSGSAIDAKMSCSGEGGMQGQVALQGTMTSTSSSITMETIQPAPNGEQMVMKMKVSSKRVGDCA